MSNLLSNLNRDKIKISNKGFIEMSLFLSFLKVEVSRNKNNLGHHNGWTQFIGDNDLIIGGGIVNGVEYLDSIQYKKKLSDPYSNYVNPFFIKEILNEQGIKFFLDFYKNDIEKIQKELENKLKIAEKNIDDFNNLLNDIGYFNNKKG